MARLEGCDNIFLWTIHIDTLFYKIGFTKEVSVSQFMVNFTEKVSQVADVDKMPKLKKSCARKEVDKRYKVTPGGTRSLSVANNQTRLWLDVSCRVEIDRTISSLCQAC